MRGPGNVDRVHVLILFILVGMLLAVMTLWSMEEERDPCRAKCRGEGMWPIHVSKSATCLCYDSSGVLRVPTDPTWRHVDTDPAGDTSR